MDGIRLGDMDMDMDMQDGMILGIFHGDIVDGIHLSTIVAGAIHGIMEGMEVITVEDMGMDIVAVSAMDTIQA